MEKATNNTAENVRSSVSSIYADLLNRRNEERQARAEAKEKAKEEKRLAREQEGEEGWESKKISKKEKREAEFNNWQQIIVGLTGDDLEYSSPKKKGKKKYKKWILDDEVKGDAMVQKKKKAKKKNYNKEFEAELSMLKSIVADQNRFTNDLQKRFQNAAGPATKDAMPLNKTLVELAAAVNTSRSNALGYLNAISGIKKTIAELYMKQKKLESDLAGGVSEDSSRDLALLGSSLASAMYGDNGAFGGGDNPNAAIPSAGMSMGTPSNPNSTNIEISAPSGAPASDPYGGIRITRDFDPSSWDGDGISVTAEMQAEATPHDVVVFKNKSTGEITAKAFRKDNGEELPNCPLPFGDLSKLKINEDSMTAKNEFDLVFPVQYI